MAQTNFTPISLYYSTTAAAVPTAGNLVAGELAINTQDGKLFYKDAAGVVQTIASKDINSGVFPAGTVSAPSITFVGDTNTGIYSPAADTIAFTEGGVESMRINASGNVGIGTASPSGRLHVSTTGSATDLFVNSDISTSALASRILLGNSLGTARLTLGLLGGGGEIGYFGSEGSFPIVFQTAGTERMRITSTGLVGIGTASPTNRLFVADNSSSAMIYATQSGAGDLFAVANSTAERFRITNAGNVGIGIDSPAVKLVVKGTSNYDGVIRADNNGSLGGGIVQIAKQGTTIGSFTLSGAVLGDTSTDLALFADTVDAGIRFYTNGGNERMRIDGAGVIGMGTSTLDSWTRLKVQGTAGAQTGAAQQILIAAPTTTVGHGAGIRFNAASGAKEAVAIIGVVNEASGVNGALVFHNYAGGADFPERMRITSGGQVLIGKTSTENDTSGINLSSLPNFVTNVSGSDGPYIQIVNLASSITSGYRFYSFRIGSSRTEVGSISTNGTSSTSYTTSSDYRLKENIAPMTGALATVSALKPVTYKWKSDGSDGQGFIAHELQEVMPDCVVGEKDAVNEDGSIKAQSIDTSFLVATLTAAIQEQQALIENLTTRLNALENK
jgi:hypothetical protein